MNPQSFHWILSFLDTSFPQPFLTRMQFWLRSSLDLNLVNPLPLGITELCKSCLHVVLDQPGRLSRENSHSHKYFQTKASEWKSMANPSKFLCEGVAILPYLSYLQLNFNPSCFTVPLAEKIRNLSFLNDTMNLTKPLSRNFFFPFLYSWWGKESVLERKSY